jgi:hypothetical protein
MKDGGRDRVVDYFPRKIRTMKETNKMKSWYNKCFSHEVCTQIKEKWK